MNFLLYTINETGFSLSKGESLKIKEEAKLPKLTTCTRCNYVSSQDVCKACILLEGLNRGLPRLGIGKSSKVNRMRAEQEKQCLCRTSQINGCLNRENNHRTESDCVDDVVDKKCLCRGVVDNKRVGGGVDLKSTRKLLKKLDL